MKSTLVIIALAAFFSSTEACKCISPNGVNTAASSKCCTDAGGSWNGSDCPVGPISENLSTFAGCCEGFSDKSDCDCPIGCAREIEALRAAKGFKPVTDEEIMAIVAKYN